jgi:hypothetical protein
MNKFKFYFIVIIASVSLFSCTKDDPAATVEPPRDYNVQYNTEIIVIEDYLKTHYLDMDLTNPNFADNDVVIKKIDNGQPSIMSYLNATTYPKLLFRTVNMHNIEKGYRLYYLVLRPGVGESPCNVDGVLASYKGTYLSKTVATAELTSTFFEELKYPQAIQDLYGVNGVITGWTEIFPQFKTGTYSIKNDGTVSHNDFGAGVMFIPSGLGYYNRGVSIIPAYSPLVFSFKLYSIQRLDQDNDGVFSYQEGLNNDGYIYDYRNTFNYPTIPTDESIRYKDDTDKDGIPDFIDIDDDGDNYTTKLEIKRPDILTNGVSVSNGYYPFDGAKDANGNPFDNPLTPNINEGQGIPSYEKDNVIKFDYTTPNRKRVHLNENYPLKP